MSLELKPVQVRLPADAYQALDIIAEVEGKDLGEVAREILIESLLGKSHAIRLLASRLSRATKSGSER